MKFFSVALLGALFCAVAVSAAPSSSPFTNEFSSELSLFDESTFGVTDIIRKVLNSLIEKTKCTLDVIEGLIGDDSLLKVFKKFRADIESIIQNDALECIIVEEGLVAKLKCALKVTKKINSLYFTFIKEVLKTNKDLATKITKALIQCAKKPAPFISNEDAFISLENEMATFGLNDILEKIYDALIKKTKCALDAIDEIIDDGELRNVFKKLRHDIETILLKDVKECARTNGLIAKTKCFLSLQQKINTLFANFIKDVLKTNKEVAKRITKALYHCVRPSKPDTTTTTTTEKPTTSTTTTQRTTTTRKPTPTTTTRKPTPTTTTTYKPRTTTTEEPDTSIENVFISSFENEMTFGLTDSIAKVMNSLIEKTKCTLDVIEKVIGDGALKNVFNKFRSDIQTVLKVNVTECVHTKGFTPKLKCTYTITKKINSLYFNFIKTVLKTNKDVAVNITKSLYQCSKKQATFISNEVFTPVSTEMTFGLTDSVTDLLNALLEKTKCALDAIEDLLEEGELKNVYLKLRADVEAILKNDVQQCKQVEGVVGKLKCALTVTQKINTLFANFTKEVLKANKDVAGKIYAAIVKCAKKTN